jgi:hypothetical protein
LLRDAWPVDLQLLRQLEHVRGEGIKLRRLWVFTGVRLVVTVVRRDCPHRGRVCAEGHVHWQGGGLGLRINLGTDQKREREVGWNTWGYSKSGVHLRAVGAKPTVACQCINLAHDALVTVLRPHPVECRGVGVRVLAVISSTSARSIVETNADRITGGISWWGQLDVGSTARWLQIRRNRFGCCESLGWWMFLQLLQRLEHVRGEGIKLRRLWLFSGIWLVVAV